MDIQLHDLIFEPYISTEEINHRIEELGAALLKEYGEEIPVFLGMLSGAFVFMADLIRAYDAPCETSFVKYHSYRGLKSTGKLKEALGVDAGLEGKTVIIVEDIIDSGNTMKEFLPIILEKNPKKVVIVTLLYKPEALEHELSIDHIGFSIDNIFVVGYGLDYDGLGRNLKDIYKLKP